MSELREKVSAFLANNGLKIRVAIRSDVTHEYGAASYRATICRNAKWLAVYLWKTMKQHCPKPTAGEVLAFIGTEAQFDSDNKTFHDFCLDNDLYEGNQLSETAWKNRNLWAKQMRSFFTAEELRQLRDFA